MINTNHTFRDFHAEPCVCVSSILWKILSLLSKCGRKPWSGWRTSDLEEWDPLIDFAKCCCFILVKFEQLQSLSLWTWTWTKSKGLIEMGLHKTIRSRSNFAMGLCIQWKLSGLRLGKTFPVQIQKDLQIPGFPVVKICQLRSRVLLLPSMLCKGTTITVT